MIQGESDTKCKFRSVLAFCRLITVESFTAWTKTSEFTCGHNFDSKQLRSDKTADLVSKKFKSTNKREDILFTISKQVNDKPFIFYLIHWKSIPFKKVMIFQNIYLSKYSV